jgi:Sigma-70 region 2
VLVASRARSLVDPVPASGTQAHAVSDMPRPPRHPAPDHGAATTSIPVGTGAWESDGELMRRVQGNDPGALEQLYERHATRALRVALAICHDADRAEDAVQEAFVGVWRGRLSYQPAAGPFVDWAMSIVRGRATEATRG